MKKLLLILTLLPFLTFAQDGEFKTGKLTIGTTNGVTLDSIEGLLLRGTATQWDDVTVGATQTKVTPATSKPELNIDSLALMFVHDADSNERAYYIMQLPHGYVAESDVHPHIHWIQLGAADTTFNIKLKYRVHPIGGVSGTWKWITQTRRAALTTTGFPFPQILTFPMVPCTGCAESSVIDFVLYRYDNIGLVTVYVKEFDIHIQKEKEGTVDEYPTVP